MSYINIFITVYAALFPVVNPLGCAPIFLTYMQGSSRQTQSMVAGRVALYGFVLLLGSLLFGAKVLLFFGVTLPVLRIAGGMVVATVGWRLLFQTAAAADDKASTPPMSQGEAESMAFFPITLPLTVGPGAIATTIALAAGHASVLEADPFTVTLDVAAAIAALAATCLTVFFCYREAALLQRMLGPNGTNVLVRLFAFIVLSIGIQIVWLGARGLLAELGH